LCSEDATHDVYEMPPFRASLAESARAARREPVDAPPRSAPLALARIPGAGDQAFALEAIQGRVEAAFLEPQRPAAGISESAQDLEPMRLARLERSQRQNPHSRAAFMSVNMVGSFNTLRRRGRVGSQPPASDST